MNSTKIKTSWKELIIHLRYQCLIGLPGFRPGGRGSRAARRRGGRGVPQRGRAGCLQGRDEATEGTILTVVREAAEAAQRAAAGSFDIRAVLDETVREAHSAVERTIDQLAVLREAGVVDAGGFGLAVIFEGLTRAVGEAVVLRISRMMNQIWLSVGQTCVLHLRTQGNSLWNDTSPCLDFPVRKPQIQQ